MGAKELLTNLISPLPETYNVSLLDLCNNSVSELNENLFNEDSRFFLSRSMLGFVISFHNSQVEELSQYPISLVQSMYLTIPSVWMKFENSQIPKVAKDLPYIWLHQGLGILESQIKLILNNSEDKVEGFDELLEELPKYWQNKKSLFFPLVRGLEQYYNSFKS